VPLATDGEESRRFLKKAPQKLLLCWVMGCVDDNAHGPHKIKVFLLLFVHKKKRFLAPQFFTKLITISF
jgi:hypothetical protein